MNSPPPPNSEGDRSRELSPDPDYDPARDGRFYRGIIFYVNPDDPRLWVPKRWGYGWSLNFAYPAAWWIVGGLLGIALLALLGAFVSMLLKVYGQPNPE